MKKNITNIEEKRKKKIKNKIKKKKIIRFLIISVILGYFLTRVIPMAMSSYIKTETVTREVFVDSIDTKGVVVKDEVVYESNANNIEFEKKDGQRVGIGERIAVFKTDGFKNQQTDLTDLGEAIELYKGLVNEYNWLKGLAEKEEDALKSYLDYFKEKTGINDENRINSIKSDIINGTDGNLKFFNQTIEDLEKERDTIQKSLKNEVKNYVTEVPGIVSSNIDGFESDINLEMTDELGLSGYSRLKEKLEESEKLKSAKGVKVVKTHDWQLIMELDLDYESEIKDKTSIEVEFADGEFKLKGNIKKVEKGEKLLVVLDFNKGLHRVYDKRYVDISIVKGNYNGLKVPSAAITEKDGTRGVLIKEVSGIVSFVPIRVVYKGEDYSIVNEEEQGLISVVENGEKTEYRSLQVFDEVFKNSNLVRENQVIN